MLEKSRLLAIGKRSFETTYQVFGETGSTILVTVFFYEYDNGKRWYE